MKYTFINGRVAVIIRYWEQRGKDVEGGARVDIRRVTQVEGPAHRAGAAGFTVDPVGSGGIWRADLFIVLSDDGRQCFHFHPAFRDSDVGERVDDETLAVDPRGWIEQSLRQLPAILESSGAGELVSSIDMSEHSRAIPMMMLAIDTCLARLPVSLAAAPNRGGPTG